MRRDEPGDLAPPRAIILTHVAFFLLIALVLVRALTLETLREPFDVSPGAASIPRALTAAPSAVLDWIAIVPALLVLLRAALDRTFVFRRARSFAFLAALAAWAAFSPLWSDDRFAAVVGVCHFVSAVAIFWAAMQLVRDGQRLRLIAGACFGLLLALLASAMIYRFVELPDLQKSVERDWPNILAQHGWEAASFVATQFHKKLMSGELTGFSNSPNTFAAVLVSLTLISTGIAVQRFADRDGPVVPILLALPLPATMIALYFTHSKAACATLVLGALLIVALALARPIARRHHAKMFLAALLLVIVGSVAIVAFGLRHNNLVQDSLTFRWRYWIGSVRMIRQHPLRGVGWNNFGDHYLVAREPIASEEIRDPHNLPIRIATELGAVGLVLLIGWLIALAWEFSVPLSTSNLTVDSPRSQTSAALPPLIWLCVITVAGIAISALDFSQDSAWLFVELLKLALYGGLILIGLIIVTFASFKRQVLDDRAAPWIALAIAAGLAMFLLHNTIDFSFFESGPMWLAMLLAGAAVGSRKIESPRILKRSSAITITSTAWLAWIVAGAAIILPVVIAETTASAGDDLLRADHGEAAAEKFRTAFSSLPFSNADYLTRAARAEIYAHAPPDEVRASLLKAIAADPSAPGAAQMLAHFESQQSPGDHARIVDAFERVLRLDPNDVQSRLAYAAALQSLGLSREAIEQYREALNRNAELSPDEPKRLPVEQVMEIERSVKALSG